MNLLGFSVARTAETVSVTARSLTYVFERDGRSIGRCVRVEVDYAFGFFYERSNTPIPSQVVSYDRRLCPLKLVGLSTARALAAEAAAS